LRVPENAILAKEKFQQYLLKKQPDSDKSGFLAGAGYTIDNWQILRDDIRRQLLPLDAILSRETPFGRLYEIRGVLHGPNGKQLNVVSVWMIESGSNVTKFITLYPDKEK
jgi:hypothetical protein